MVQKLLGEHTDTKILRYQQCQRDNVKQQEENKNVIYRNEVSVMLVFHMAITKRRRMDV
jgi:hypothetical protein